MNAALTCPACGTALALWNDGAGYTADPRYWCPNLKCPNLPSPVRLHPAPWRWEGGDDADEAAWLKDANGGYLLSPNINENISIASPHVRALTEAAPQLHTGVVALLDIVNQMVADAWPQRVVPDDVGPICANLRALTDAISRKRYP